MMRMDGRRRWPWETSSSVRDTILAHRLRTGNLTRSLKSVLDRPRTWWNAPASGLRPDGGQSMPAHTDGQLAAVVDIVPQHMEDDLLARAWAEYLALPLG